MKSEKKISDPIQRLWRKIKRRDITLSRRLVCFQCGALVEVLEPRKKGDVTRKKGDAVWEDRGYIFAMCATCVHDNKYSVDALLKAAANPLDEVHFRAFLENCRRVWRDRQPQQFTGETIFQIGSGCMICGADPVDWWLITDLSVTRYPYLSFVSNFLTARADNQNAIWPELVNIAQLLWRLGSQDYFSAVPHFPIKNLPLLPLCAGCAQRNDIEQTHQAVLTGEAGK